MTYTKESIKEINGAYLSQYGNEVTDKVLNDIKYFAELITSHTGKSYPSEGDVVCIQTARGDYYPRAHIHEIDGDTVSLCALPYIPFVNEYKNKPIFSVSGGPWYTAKISELQPAGSKEKFFKIWGNRGPGYNSSLMFPAVVSCWIYKEANPLYGEYSTKDYNKQYIYRHEPNEYGYRITGNCMAWKNEKEFKFWLETYRGVEFPNPNDENSSAVFTWKEQEYLISPKLWDDLPYPVDTRLCNGVILVKVRYDEAEHIIHTYRFTNRGTHGVYPLYKRAKERRNVI